MSRSKKRKATRRACMECGEVYGALSLYACRVCKREFCSSCLNTGESAAGACKDCIQDLVDNAARKTITPQEIGDARTKIEKVRKLTEKLAETRDELRELYQDMAGNIQDIVESIGEGAETLEHAFREMDDGLDKCSELI